jgi:hypothetical protein
VKRLWENKTIMIMDELSMLSLDTIYLSSVNNPVPRLSQLRLGDTANLNIEVIKKKLKNKKVKYSKETSFFCKQPLSLSHHPGPPLAMARTIPLQKLKRFQCTYIRKCCYCKPKYHLILRNSNQVRIELENSILLLELCRVLGGRGATAYR